MIRETEWRLSVGEERVALKGEVWRASDPNAGPGKGRLRVGSIGVGGVGLGGGECGKGEGAIGMGWEKVVE